MRLKLKNEKIKNRFIMFAYTCFISFACLCLLPLTVHAETKNTFPLPYGPASNWGFSNPNEIVLPTNDQLLNIVSQIENSSGKTVYGLFIYEVSSDFSYVDFAVAYNDFSFYAVRPLSSELDTIVLSKLNTRTDFECDIYRYTISNGSISFRSTNWTPSLSDFWNNGYVSSSDTFYYFYPFYHKDFADIIITDYDLTDSMVGFTYVGSGGGGGFDGPGFITGEGTGTLDRDTGDLNIDFNLQYDDSAIQGKLDTIIENQEGSLDKQDTTNNWLGRIWQAITDYFTPPTQQEVTSALQGFPVFNDLTNTIGNTKTTVNSIFDFSQIQPKTADNVDFDYYFHWKVYDPSSHSFVTKTTTVHIVFSWFESVRTPVTLVLSVFLVLGFLIYIFRQIPNLINGVGGGASAGMSVAEHMKGSDKK